MGFGSIQLVSDKDYGFLEDLGMYRLLMHPQYMCPSMLPPNYAMIACPLKIIVLPDGFLLQWGKVFSSSYKYVCFIRPETH